MLTTATAVLVVTVPIASGALSSASAAKAIKGPDVASYQHPDPDKAHPHGQQIKWKKVAADGFTFAIVKATEGTSYVNPYFAGPFEHDYANAAAAGLVHGSYHFARPAVPITASAVAQAKFYAATIGPVNTAGTLPPALDLEVTGGLTPAQLDTWALTFLLELRKLTGRTPMLYTYPNFWEHDLADPSAFARYPLWMAEYGPPSAPVADLWQYTSHASIKGIHGAVDVSRFLGTSGFPWATLSDGTVATPWVPAAPAAPLAVSAAVVGRTITVAWRPGDAGTSPITSYQVTAEPGGAVTTVSGDSPIATISGLTTGTTYTFTVTATNGVGTSSASAATSPVTVPVPTVLATRVKHSLRFGAALPLQATLLRADTKAALAGKQVLLYRRPSTDAPWMQVRNLSTNKAGLATALLRPKRSAQLEAVFPGTKGVERSETFENYVVRPTVTAALSAPTVPRGQSVTLSGEVSPFVAHQRVLREGFARGAWHVWSTTRLGRHGRYHFRIAPHARGVYTYRIVVLRTTSRGASASPKLTLTVD